MHETRKTEAHPTWNDRHFKKTIGLGENETLHKLQGNHIIPQDQHLHILKRPDGAHWTLDKNEVVAVSMIDFQ